MEEEGRRGRRGGGEEEEEQEEGEEEDRISIPEESSVKKPRTQCLPSLRCVSSYEHKRVIKSCGN